jgi:hypothetical protein
MKLPGPLAKSAPVIVHCMLPGRKVVGVLFTLTILSGCIVSPPRVTVGSIYSVDVKIDAWSESGKGAPCFADRNNLWRYRVLDRRRLREVTDALDDNYAIFLQLGDKVVVLAVSADQSELELKRLSTGRVCYAMNEGAGPGLGLFGPCTHLGIFDWHVPTEKCDTLQSQRESQ